MLSLIILEKIEKVKNIDKISIVNSDFKLIPNRYF